MFKRRTKRKLDKKQNSIDIEALRRGVLKVSAARCDGVVPDDTTAFHSPAANKFTSVVMMSIDDFDGLIRDGLEAVRYQDGKAFLCWRKEPDVSLDKNGEPVVTAEFDIFSEAPVPKWEVGDRVWIMRDNKPIEAVVYGAAMIIGMFKAVYPVYCVMAEEDHGGKQSAFLTGSIDMGMGEGKIFPTKQDLLDSL